MVNRTWAKNPRFVSFAAAVLAVVALNCLRWSGVNSGNWADVDSNAANTWLTQAGAEGLIHGHTHRPAVHLLPGGRTRQVLGDWDFDQPPYRARLLRLTSAGLQSLDLARAAAVG